MGTSILPEQSSARRGLIERLSIFHQTQAGGHCPQSLRCCHGHGYPYPGYIPISTGHWPLSRPDRNCYDHGGSLWRNLDSLGDNAYGIYPVHCSIAALVQFGPPYSSLPGILEGLIASGTPLGLSWALVLGVRQIQAVRKVIEQLRRVFLNHHSLAAL